jgi:hypothetical protein
MLLCSCHMYSSKRSKNGRVLCHIFCVSLTYRVFKYRHFLASTDGLDFASLYVVSGGEGEDREMSIILKYEKVEFEQLI